MLDDTSRIDAPESKQTLEDRIKAGGFAIALSGGGHRATLATLGSLMAIIDRGLGPKIIQVASVSGGSITNAFVAQRTRLEKLDRPGQLDEIAKALATSIISKGVLTKGWYAILALAVLIVGTVAGAAAWIGLDMFAVPWKWPAAVIGVAVGLVGLLGRGLAVEWLLDRRYFRSHTSKSSGGYWGRASLASLSGGQVDHVFCMTDLVLGLPVYASSQHGGFIWRRLKLDLDSITHTRLPQTFAAGRLSIAEIVRASAAFPGISPRRLQIPSDPRNPFVAEVSRVAYLADGGLWNNLGSQVIREDGFVGSQAAWENGVIRPKMFFGPRTIPLFCFNGSAPIRPEHSGRFRIPVFALLRTLWQTANILTANTVLPRIDAMKLSFHRRADDGTRPGRFDPVDLVADLRAIEDVADDYRCGAWQAQYIRESDSSVKDWERSALMRVRIAKAHIAEDSESDWLTYMLAKASEPQGSYPVVGLASIDDWNSLRTSSVWKQIVECEGVGKVAAPTTLGCIDKELARRLIARGYLNTYLVSLFLAPLHDDEIDQLAELPGRLDKIVQR